MFEEDYGKLPPPLPLNDPLPVWAEGLDQNAYQAILGLHQSAHHMDTDEPVVNIPVDELNEYKRRYNVFVQKKQHPSDNELESIKWECKLKLSPFECADAARDYVEHNRYPQGRYIYQKDYLQVLYDTDQWFESAPYTAFNRAKNAYLRANP